MMEGGTVEGSNNARSLYVGNIDPTVTEPQLTDLFSTIRPVLSTKIIPDKRNPQGPHYGFVEFGTHQDALLALQTLNGHRVMDYEIKVNWAFNNEVEDTSGHFHVFVGDLSAEVNDQVLTKAFGVYPSMSDARVMWDMGSGRSRGFGFVAFRDRQDAERALEQMQGEWLGSRAIRVNWANQRGSSKPRDMSFEAVCDQTAQYNTTVYMGNLTNYTTQEQLQQICQGYGYVMEIRMQLDRGYAFVKMDSHENAAMIITQVNGQTLNGRPVKCSWGKDRLPGDRNPVGGNPAYTYPYVYGMPPQQQGWMPGGSYYPPQQPMMPPQDDSV